MPARILPPGSTDEAVVASEIEVPGIKIDKFGNKFAIPRGEDDGLPSDPLTFPYKEPGFYYYYEKIDNVPAAIAKGFAPVTRKQAGFKTVEGLPKEYGYDAGDTPHRIADLVLLKAPQEVYDAIDKGRQRIAREAVRPILKNYTERTQVEANGNVQEETVKEASFTASRIAKEE